MKPPICPGPCNNCNRTAIRSRNPETGDMEWTPVTDWLCPICADPAPARALPSEAVQAMARRASRTAAEMAREADRRRRKTDRYRRAS